MIKYIDEIPLEGQRVLMRVDCNVPLDVSGEIADDNRIRAVLPSVRHAVETGARLILCAHLGHPKGRRVEKYSLSPVALRLGELIGQEVFMADDCIGPEVDQLKKTLANGQVLLLENLRYYKGETENDPDFAAALASQADVYINDAFAVSHRPHASVVGIPGLVKKCGAGLLMKNELTYYEKAMHTNPARPMVAILGGAKVSTKLGGIKNVIPKVDKIIIGGAMANTFLMAMGQDMGRSLIEPELVDTARSLMNEAEKRGVQFLLPTDCVVAPELSENAPASVVEAGSVPPDQMVLDIGPETTELFCSAVENAGTIVWNGPMGAFEIKPFSRGTMELAHAVGRSSALSIIGGGDTDLAIHLAGETDNVSYMSTGGGAFLHLLEGKELPGIKALEEAC
ncbi:MAG TPA: phosphoglycerate kinase [Thermodesulfobacteriaceae bacterium]|nr:phosphoglycerate kinase [Thermodesulfobacteriaceae bacterium]